MKKVCVFLFLAIIAWSSFSFGRFWQDFQTGHWYQRTGESAFDSAFGTVFVSHEISEVGRRIVTTAFSTISIKDGPIIYRVKEAFQDSPFVDRVKVNDAGLEWNDGHVVFQLDLKPSQRKNQSDRPAS